MYICLILSVFHLVLMMPCFGSVDIGKLSIEQKVGQLLIVHFNGEEVNPAAKLLVQQLGVGGIIYYNWSNGLYSPEQVQRLSSGLQNLAKDQANPIPLLIMVDQEGGRVARLTQGFSSFPSNHEVGLADQPEYAERVAFSIASELRAVGINMNLAPVVDIDEQGKPAYIGSRSFGDSPEKVISCAKMALSGYRNAGIIAALKHFPGHGSVKVDTHLDLPVLLKSKFELEEREFRPFRALVEEAEVIMTGHILVPEIDAVNCATLSKTLLDILRKEIGYAGLIISDSLVMEGLLKNCECIDEAAIRAFNAGCDLLLLGGKQLQGSRESFELSEHDIHRIHKAITAAVKNGLISHERLNESVERILRIKEKYMQFET